MLAATSTNPKDMAFLDDVTTKFIESAPGYTAPNGLEQMDVHPDDMARYGQTLTPTQQTTILSGGWRLYVFNTA